ncbi:MAG: LysR family transcriptional regulator [Myxococcota bacterium]
MFRWDDLQVLLAVHRHGSLSAAARSLSIDGSTASRRLRALESALDAKLFERTPDGLVSTGLSERLLPAAEQAEAAARSVTAIAAGSEVTPTGTVRVAVTDAFANYVIAPMLPDLLDAFPGLHIELLASPSVVDLSRLQAEIAVRFVRPEQGDLIAQCVSRAGQFGGWVHSTYVERHGPVTGMPVHWIGWSLAFSHLSEAQLYDRVVGVPPRLRCDNLTTMIEAWIAGAGALLLPQAVAQSIPGAIRTPEPESKALELSTWVVTHASMRHVPRVRVVRDWLVTRIQEYERASSG